MWLNEMFKRQVATDESYVQLESNLSQMLMVEMVPSIATDDEMLEEVGSVDATGSEIVAAEPPHVPELPRTTPYTQTRLAEFAALEELQQSAQLELAVVSDALAKIKVAQHQTREFLNGIHANIHRTNDLELSAVRLADENRVLFRQAEHINRLRSQHEALCESVKRRETKLLETAEALRAALSGAKLDLVAAQSTIGHLEADRQDTANSLAFAATQAERTTRENEVLREKQINLAADLEAASRKRTEAERRVDEFAAIHARDAADLAEARLRLGATETERQRLQKQKDALQAQLTEASEALAALEGEMEQATKRHDLTMQGLKSERDTLQARLEVAARAEIDASSRMGELTERLNEAHAERRILEEKFAALERDREAERDAATALRRDAAIPAQL